jgi:hypothetical protein
LTNTKRVGRYHNLSTNNNNNEDNSSLQSYINELASSFYKENSGKPLVDWDKPLFVNKHASLQKVLANANKAIELNIEGSRL